MTDRSGRRRQLTATNGHQVELELGEMTEITVTVTSVDKTATQDYVVNVYRRDASSFIGRHRHGRRRRRDLGCNDHGGR